MLHTLGFPRLGKHFLSVILGLLILLNLLLQSLLLISQGLRLLLVVNDLLQ